MAPPVVYEEERDNEEDNDNNEDEDEQDNDDNEEDENNDNVPLKLSKKVTVDLTIPPKYMITVNSDNEFMVFKKSCYFEGETMYTKSPYQLKDNHQYFDEENTYEEDRKDVANFSLVVKKINIFKDNNDPYSKPYKSYSMQDTPKREDISKYHEWEIEYTEENVIKFTIEKIEILHSEVPSSTYKIQPSYSPNVIHVYRSNFSESDNIPTNYDFIHYRSFESVYKKFLLDVMEGRGTDNNDYVPGLWNIDYSYTGFFDKRYLRTAKIMQFPLND